MLVVEEGQPATSTRRAEWTERPGGILSTDELKAPAPLVPLEALPDAVTFDIEPVRLAPLYRAGLFVVALTMLILPLIYVALVGLVAWGVWHHATTNWGLLFIGSALGGAVAYLGPIVAGGLGVLFMVKPLFAAPARGPEPESLKRDEEPLLHAYVDALCHSLGAPAPSRIDVDMQVNASASFRRGFGSFLGEDLVLTIGLPLAGGMSVGQLTGVLAHEFGHFTQGAAMRFSYVIGRVNHWFARVVYERDAWDQRLDRWIDESTTGWAQIILAVSKGFIWLSRRLLWMLMMVGIAVSGFLSRQMEFNADLHQARVSGGPLFRATHLRLPVLTYAWSQATAWLSEMWRGKRLVDDVVPLVLIEADRLATSPEVTQQMEAQLLGERSGAFDTHPSTADRIAAIESGVHPPRMIDPRPATHLFADFESLSRKLTLSFYEGALDEPVEAAKLVPVGEAIAEQQTRIRGGEALRTYFFGSELVSFGIFPRPQAPDGIELGALRATITDLRGRMADDAEWVTTTLRRLDELAEERRLAALWVRSLDAGRAVKVGARAGGLKPPPDGTSPEDHLASLARALVELRETFEPRAAVARERAEVVLGLAARGEFPSTSFGIPVAPRLAALLAVLGAMEPQWPRLRALQQQMPELWYLLEVGGARIESGPLLDQIVELWTAMRQDAVDMRDAFRTIEYPYEHADGTVTLSDQLFAEIPEVGPAVGPFVMSAAQAIGSLYFRIWSDLAGLALEVEEAVLSASPPPASDPRSDTAPAAPPGPPPR